MTAILYSNDPSSIAAFIIFTLILGFLGGWATGRAFAGTWRPPLMLIPAVLVLGAAVRFLHYAIAGEDLTSIYYYLEFDARRDAGRQLRIHVVPRRADGATIFLALCQIERLGLVPQSSCLTGKRDCSR